MTLPFELISKSIMQNVSEGIMTVEFSGIVSYANSSAHRILGFPDGSMIGQRFYSIFLDSPENDEFVQAVLEAVYDRESTHSTVVQYTTGDRKINLHMTTSFLTEGDQRYGVIVVFGDLSGLVELQDAVKSMNRIRELNRQLYLRNEFLTQTFGRYFSDKIVRQLLNSPDGLALGGEKHYLTALMSDLRGFTALSERMEASELIDMLNHYLGEMTEIIQRRNGTIIEFIGDGILAIFGAPAVSHTHEADAVAAAVEMQFRMEEVNRWNNEHAYPHLEMGIGIDSGEMILGNIGSEKRAKYGVVGNHVNICGRIEGYTVGGQILISESTKEGVKTDLEIRSTIPATPKGSSKVMILYDVTGIGAPYNVSVGAMGTEPVPLEAARPVTYYLIENKLLLPGERKGLITAVSDDSALLETDETLKTMTNLQLDTGAPLYCKVIAERESGYLVRFTSVPPEFMYWLGAAE